MLQREAKGDEAMKAIETPMPHAWLGLFTAVIAGSIVIAASGGSQPSFAVVVAIRGCAWARR
jgi:hypothetical protein